VICAGHTAVARVRYERVFTGRYSRCAGAEHDGDAIGAQRVAQIRDRLSDLIESVGEQAVVAAIELCQI
jgi:hypothetical protein